MSRFGSSGVISTRPTNNVYTALAFISMVATFGALLYVLVRFSDHGLLK